MEVDAHPNEGTVAASRSWDRDLWDKGVPRGHHPNVCNVDRSFKNLVHKLIAKPLLGCYGCSVRIIILEWLSGRSDQKAIPESGNPRRRAECH
jgi:hypothetical protein